MTRKSDVRGAPERRTLTTPLEVRAVSAASVTLTGYASVFDAPYDIMGGPPFGWTETVDSKAFDQTLAGKPDLHLLINHEGMPLARTKSGTLQLSADDYGLHVQADLDRGDPDVQRLERKMARGDIDEMSFAFRTIRDSWDHEEIERRLLEVSIDKGDVSVVNFGANPATNAELQRALRALHGRDLAGAQQTVNELMARDMVGRITRPARPRTQSRAPGDMPTDMPPTDMADMDPGMLCMLLLQSLGWLTAIDNIADGITENDPEYAGADLSTLLIAIDAIAGEGMEAITDALGMPSADPDDVEPGEALALPRTPATVTRRADGKPTMTLAAARGLLASA
jgi:HK97 family phage prohead protease